MSPNHGSPRTRPLFRLALIVAVAFGLQAIALLGVQAYNFGPGGGLYYTQNFYQQHHYWDLTAGYANAATYVRNNESANTDMSLVYQSDYQTAEVRQVDGDWGKDTALGFTYCYEITSDTVCHIHKIAYNLYWAVDQYHVACHEMGHAVALRHRDVNDGCMASSWRHWSAHSRDHVNKRY